MGAYIDNPVFKHISEIAFNDNIELYVVGGYVRDKILGRQTGDIDIVVIGSGIDFARRTARVLKGSSKISVFKNFGTAMLRYDKYQIEFVGARKESYRSDSRKPFVETGTLEDDQMRRDFTINAMAVGLGRQNYGMLTDPFNGIEDLKKGLIRTPLDPGTTFSDDPLRMIRAIRFATQLNFKIEDATFNAISVNLGRISIISQERITEELNKIILADKPSRGFQLLDKTGLLEIILPEFHALKGVEVVKGRMHKDNFQHTLKVLDNLSEKTDNLWLRWAAILHDIAKPGTKSYCEEAGWTFHGHDYIGAKMIPEVFRRLRLPLNDKMKFVQKLVKLHLRPVALAGEEISDSAIRRLLYDAGDNIDDLMALCEADITSGNRKTVTRHLNNFRHVRKKLLEIEEKDAIRNFQPPVTGDQIMETFGLPPGREVGIIKIAIKNAILDGLIGNNRDEAVKFMKGKAKEMGIEPQRMR